MKYMYKNASVEAVNRVNYYRSLIKKADNSVKNWPATLAGSGIGALLGGSLGLMLSPDDIVTALLSAGVLGGIGGGVGAHLGNYYGSKE